VLVQNVDDYGGTMCCGAHRVGEFVSVFHRCSFV
jgi:hypothetical protein